MFTRMLEKNLIITGLIEYTFSILIVEAITAV